MHIIERQYSVINYIKLTELTDRDSFTKIPNDKNLTTYLSVFSTS